MATIKPLVKQRKLYDATRYGGGLSSTPLQTCLVHGGVDNSVVGVQKPVLQSHDMGLAKAANRFVGRTPLIIRQPMSSLVFHHHLHGLNGRRNDQRRPLIALGALSVLNGSGAFGNATTRQLSDDRLFDEIKMAMTSAAPWVSRGADALPPNPFAVTRCVDTSAVALERPFGPLLHDELEGIYCCVQPLRMIFGASMVESKDKAANLAPPSSTSVESVYHLRPGDVVYVPRLQPVWVEPPTFGSLVEKASMKRRPDIKPIDLNPEDWDKPATVKAAEASRLASCVPTMLWRWSYRAYPEVAGKSPVYIAAHHTGGYGDFYGAHRT